MQEGLTKIMENPLLSIVLALLCFLLIFFLLKSLLRIALFTGVLFVLYLVYINYLQEDYPLPQINQETIDQWAEKATELLPEDFNLSVLDSNYTREDRQD